MAWRDRTGVQQEDGEGIRPSRDSKTLLADQAQVFDSTTVSRQSGARAEPAPDFWTSGCGWKGRGLGPGRAVGGEGELGTQLFWLGSPPETGSWVLGRRLPAGRPSARGSSPPAPTSRQEEAGLRGRAGFDLHHLTPFPLERSPWNLPFKVRQGGARVSVVGPDSWAWILALPPPTREPWAHHQTSMPQCPYL